MAKEFTTSVGATFPIVLDDQEVAHTLFDIPGTPTNLFIDPSGKILFKSIGYTPGHEKVFVATIEEMLSKTETLGAVVR